MFLAVNQNDKTVFLGNVMHFDRTNKEPMQKNEIFILRLCRISLVLVIYIINFTHCIYAKSNKYHIG